MVTRPLLRILLATGSGAALVFLAAVAAISFFIHGAHSTSPDATVGFSPGQLVQAPIIFVPMLLLFAVGFASAYFLLRR